ncbi:MAG: amidohydrolase, partial [Pseudomonadota bacterium]
MSETTIFQARKVLTMDPNRPEATHIAVRDGRILAVGGADCAEPWGGGQRDERLADWVLMPGFVEGHAHLMAGGMWRFPYVGYHGRTDPEGKAWPGLDNIDAVIARLRDADAALPPDQPLYAWG